MSRPQARANPLRSVLVLGLVLLVVALVGAPLTFLVRGALEQGTGVALAALTTTEFRVALWHTVALAVLVTTVSLVTGTTVALAFDRAQLRHPTPWRVALLLPLLVPQFSLTLSWTQAYGPSGLLDHLAGVTLPDLFGMTGIALVMIVDAVPVVWLVVTAGLAVRREPDLVRAARASGAGVWVTVRTIDLPLLRAPMLAAGAVVLVGVVNSFAVPQVLGSARGYRTLATLAYQQLSLSAAPAAFSRLCVVALVMVLLVLMTVGAADRGLGRVGAGLVRTGSGGAPFVHRPTILSRMVAGCLTAYVVLTMAVPLVSLAVTSVTRAAGLPPVPANWAWTNYTSGMAGQAVAALTRTLLLAAAAAVVVTALAGLVLATGSESRRRLGTALTLGYAVPGTALAIGVLVAYGRWLGGSAAIILVAYLGKCWALGYRALASGADRLAPELGQAARASGARPVTVLRTVTGPVMSSGYLAAAALVVLFAIHELTMSSILYGPATETFAVVVLNQQQLGDVGTSAALAVVLTLPPLLVLGLASALVARRRTTRLGSRRQTDAPRSPAPVGAP